MVEIHNFVNVLHTIDIMQALTLSTLEQCGNLHLVKHCINKLDGRLKIDFIKWRTYCEKPT